MTKKEEEELRIFERKIIRQILGPINTGENEYRPRMNFEIRDQMKGEDIVNYIKSQRIKWLGHVMRKDKTKTIRIVTEWKPTENRKRGKPKIRWIDDVVDDLKTLEIKNWKVKCHNRTEWSRIAEEAKNSKKLI
ncbi:hypothetical protein RN001_003028 [Aquatica leii]|uniref:Uncharacterized protein n=1 Tax=Aquatica leii TaxID=1421715 RepID=A0AAN7Q8K0_9COLE|nr:hypothetical protein RN001_006089 [Aquatica leii]KAK4886757.1 hypothetical protein RN001_003028 [Aquatica leii]